VLLAGPWIAVGLAPSAPGQGAGGPTSRPATSQGTRPETQSASQPSGFIVATYNINYGNVNLKNTVETIRKAKADLVCLQETNKDSEKAVREALGAQYPYMTFHDQPGAAGFAILAKSPLKNVRVIRRQFGPHDTVLADVEPGGRIVTVVNVHLQPTVPAETDGLPAMMRLFLKTEAIRIKEIELIHKGLPKDRPVILLGDFNSISNMTVPTYLAAAGFIDSFAAVNKDADQHITWHWKRGKVEWKFRLDYIFHGREFKTITSSIVPGGPSDHYLVVSALTWADKPAATSPTRPAKDRAASMP
jgi:endonuclease/exonuclease/phosphatase family metal-dependent hydrolase